jgi:molybdopterin-guanine dinucleotide biosynthesis protein MobB
MRVFAISGFSGTGKTTLLETIVKSLVKSGYSIATVKSSHHEPGPKQGKDTWRHIEAGASLTIFLRASNEDVKLKERISAPDLAVFSKHDFLIIEGMKSSNIPKFWCVGDTKVVPDEIPINTHAIVSWSENSGRFQNIPVIAAGQIEQLIKIVKSKALGVSEID